MKKIDSSAVPKKKLYTGAEIPCVGMGTFGSDRVEPKEVSEAVEGAVRCGYRLFDCAACYGNEAQIGQVFQKVFQEKIVERSELFIMSKVWNDMHREVEKACRKSIEELQCGYLDMYFIHWPFPNYHAPGCDADARNPMSKPFSAEEFLDTYRQCEELVEKGLIRHIGISNMTIPKMEATLGQVRIKPAAAEIEMHPAFQQRELKEYLEARGIVPVGYMPIGSPRRPERDIMAEDVVDLEMPQIQEIAVAHGISPAAVALKWARQNGQIPIPFSVHHYYENLKCMTEETLTEEELEMIAGLECGNRLVKGHVFLWEDAKDWHDIWDE